MKRYLWKTGMAAALMLAWAGGWAQGHHAYAKGTVVYMSAGDAAYKPMAESPKVSTAAIWGDNSQGAHATYSKFEPGYDAGMHTHTNDVWIVGIKGAYLYKDDDGEKRVGPGDFLRVPGGHKHWSGGDKTEGAVFYEESNGKFDLNAAK